jgi:hypothetical protein
MLVIVAFVVPFEAPSTYAVAPVGEVFTFKIPNEPAVVIAKFGDLLYTTGVETLLTLIQ